MTTCGVEYYSTLVSDLSVSHCWGLIGMSTLDCLLRFA